MQPLDGSNTTASEWWSLILDACAPERDDKAMPSAVWTHPVAMTVGTRQRVELAQVRALRVHANLNTTTEPMTYMHKRTRHCVVNSASKSNVAATQQAACTRYHGKTEPIGKFTF